MKDEILEMWNDIRNPHSTYGQRVEAAFLLFIQALFVVVAVTMLVCFFILLPKVAFVLLTIIALIFGIPALFHLKGKHDRA